MKLLTSVESGAAHETSKRSREEAIKRWFLRGGAIYTSLLLTATAIVGSAPQEKNPPVRGRITETANVTLANGNRVELTVGTLVTARCVSGGPFQLRSSVDSGEHKGSTAEDVPRANVDAITDPYGARQVEQDPFGPLPHCED